MYTAITVYLDSNVDSLGKNFDYLNSLFVRRLKIQLETVIDSAGKANIEVNLSSTRQGLKLEVSGSAGNWAKLMADLLSLFTQPELNALQVKDSLTSHIRGLQGQRKTRLSKKTQQLLDSRLGLSVATNQSLAYFDTFDEKRYQQFSQTYLASAHLSGFYYGHISAQEWQAINRSLQLLATKIIHPIPAAIDRWDGGNMQQLQTQSIGLADANSAVRLLLMSKDQSVFSVANIELLGAMIKAPFFHQLRTQEQLGYTVSASAKVRYGQPLLSYYVQSPVATSSQLLKRIKRFNNWYLTYLTNMPAEQFELMKQHLATSMQQPLINSASAEAQLRNHFRKGRSIDYDQQLQRKIRTMPQSDFLGFALQILSQPLQGILVDPIGISLKANEIADF
jgi:secreted Zn-dependent insulinase-like peptidase